MPPKLHARIGQDAVAWFRAHPEHRFAFLLALSAVTSDELSLLRKTHPLHDPQLPHMQRYFRFTDNNIAIFEWNHAERKIRVHSCRRGRDRPAAA